MDSNVIAGPVTTVVGDCLPAANQVALYVYPNFGGRCSLRSLGDYPEFADLGLPNDSLSSLRLGSGVRVELCEHTFYGGRCQTFAGSVSDLSAFSVGDNQVSSARVQSAPAASQRVYVPLLRHVTPAAAPLPNGGFESGPITWGLSSALGRGLVLPASDLQAQTGVRPRTGNWAAWLGGPSGETASMWQTVVVPAQTPHLMYWQRVSSQESRCHYDYATVWVNNTVVDAYGLCAELNGSQWVQRSVNLSAYAGQAVSLRLQLQTDSNLDSSLFLDDFSFAAGP
jgi:hypothetical protein